MRHWVALAKEIIFPNRERHAIPPLDGALRPNELLDEATVVAGGLPDPCGLCEGAGQGFLASGASILAFNRDSLPKPIYNLDGRISALAYDHIGNGLLAGLAGRGVVGIGGRFDGRRWTRAGGAPICDPTGIAMVNGTIYVTEGSTLVEPGSWRRDLLQKGRSGRLIRLDEAADDGTVVQAGLRYPAGVGAAPDGRSVMISESWSHALRVFNGSDRKDEVVPAFGNSPGYPGHIARSASGGFWLSYFALRTQLIEFLLKEEDYCKEMMLSVPEEYWIAPRLSPSEKMLMPLQVGQIKSLGVTKPWAPPWSYGLVVEYDAAGQPVRSMHSRSGGHMHGITSVSSFGDAVYATCHAASALIRLPESAQ